MKYGVILRRYGDQEMNMWIYDEGDKPFETELVSAALAVQEKWTKRNPKGTYVVKELTDDAKAETSVVERACQPRA